MLQPAARWSFWTGHHRVGTVAGLAAIVFLITVPTTDGADQLPNSSSASAADAEQQMPLATAFEATRAAASVTTTSLPGSATAMSTSLRASKVNLDISNSSGSIVDSSSHDIGVLGNISADSQDEEPMNFTEPGTGTEGFAYHKDLFPLDQHQDGLTFVLAAIGLMIAASGGIGGGGILVPIFMLVLRFKPKHAIALSNFTILGGAIANTAVNARKRHPVLNQTLIDWDLILAMEPLTIFGAVFGSLLSKVLPNLMLTVSLVAVLVFMGQRTTKKGLQMWRDESMRQVRMSEPGDALELTSQTTATEVLNDKTSTNYHEMTSDSEGIGSQGQSSLTCKISALTVCFAGCCVCTVLKGGGRFQSPLGFACGSLGFWALYFGVVPWVLAFAIFFRYQLVSEYQAKLRRRHQFVQGEVQWDSKNTIKYPLLCAISGLLAGLFGVGGGIVKGPLMLEMGILPQVASASAAAMILYTSAAASMSYLVFGLLHPAYGILFFFLGLTCTAFGQYVVGQWVKRSNRQSPIVLSIGFVIILSSILVAVNTAASAASGEMAEMMAFHGVCDSFA